MGTTDITRLRNRTFAGADSCSGSYSPLGGMLNKSCRASRGCAVVSASRTFISAVHLIGLLLSDDFNSEDNSISIFNAFHTILAA